MALTSVVRPLLLPIVGIFLFVSALSLAYTTLMQAPAHTLSAAVLSSEVVSLTNEERLAKDLPALARNSKLDTAAQLKAEDMASKGYYAHVSPDGVTPMHWADEAGYAYLILGENLVVNRTDAGQVVDAFMKSPGHKANILRSDFTEIGIGVATGSYKGKEATFTVQMFAAPYPKSVPQVAKSSKENLKISSTTHTAKPTVKPSVPVTVPRAPLAVTPSSNSKSTSTSAVLSNLLAEKDKILIKSPLSLEGATSALALATATLKQLSLPSFSLNDQTPVALEDVSRLEAETLPVPIGSTWTMELKLFIDTSVRNTQTWLQALFPEKA